MEFLRTLLLMHHLAFAGGVANEAMQTPDVIAPGGLNDTERHYYSLVFNYAMNNVSDDKPYDWQSHSGNGSIRISKAYISKSGYICRNFSESYLVLGTEGVSQGVACKRGGNGGWCRLRLNDALTCAMEPPANGVQAAMRSASEMLGDAELGADSIMNLLP